MSDSGSKPIDASRRAPWWHEFFDDAYAAYGLVAGDPAEDAQRVEFLVRTLQLKSGDRVFDQCCGIGRLSLPLAEKGIHVVGVDRVASYVDAARREAARRQLENCEFHCADATEHVAPQPCDASINWFTSFGYQEDDDQTERMFKCAYDSLKPGGRAIFEYQNVARIMGDFQHAIVTRPETRGLEGVIIVQENTPDFMRGMMKGVWSVIYPDGRRTQRQIETRLFMPHEIVRLLRSCGFSDFELLGWRDGSAFSRSSPRLIVVCRRP